MAYSKNPQLPRVRREAAALVKKGWSARKVGRYLGFHHTAAMRWFKESERIGLHPIQTRSSRPKHHPKELPESVVQQIVITRLKNGRCAEVVHKQLENAGTKVSLSSVKRTLDRHHLIKKHRRKLHSCSTICKLTTAPSLVSGLCTKCKYDTDTHECEDQTTTRILNDSTEPYRKSVWTN